jgi:type I restriction enzyme R subunit
VQVIKQFEQTGSHANRYDVTILVNGLPLVQVELKKRGVAIREAFNQVHRYSKESFNSEQSLFKYPAAVRDLQRHRQPLLCQHHAAQQEQLRLHHELGEGGQQPDQGSEGLYRHVLPEAHLLNVLLHYSVFDVSNTLLVMRPYQIAATERILWKIKSSHQAKNWSNT